MERREKRTGGGVGREGGGGRGRRGVGGGRNRREEEQGGRRGREALTGMNSQCWGQAGCSSGTDVKTRLVFLRKIRCDWYTRWKKGHG